MPSKDADPLAENFARILCARASFELREEDVHAYKRRLSSLQHAVQVSAAAIAQEDEEYRQWQAQYPALLDSFEEFTTRADGKRVAVFLDYDGTLTPIVKNPDRAFMSDQMREAVRMVARLFPTAIISGRGREKVEGFVRLKELYYAGSHGMDIIGPRGDGDEDGSALAFQPAARFAPVMDQVYADLTAKVAGIEGAAVEHNKFCVSVHFRNCAPGAHEAVLGAVETTLRSHADLHATRGRKVFEIRPQVDWDKGSAVLHLLSALGLGGTDDCLPIYIGDDRTDEDAFKALAHAPHPGIGILVSSKVKPTQAVYTLRDPHEVHTFLQRLVAWGRSPANGWHAQPSCIGWALNMDPLPPLQERALANGGSGGLANGSCAPESNGNTGGAAGEGLHVLPNPFAETKFAAFGLQAPRGVRDPTAVSHQKSPTVRGGRPPLAPSPSSSSASALDGLADMRAQAGAAPPSDPCSPTAAAAPHDEEGEPQSRAAVDLSSLSVDDADEAQIARLLTAAGAASVSGAHGLSPAALSKLAAGLEGTPFSAVSAAHDVLAGLGLPRGRDPALGSESGRSGTFSRGYSSGGESLHFSHSGPLVADGEPEIA